MMRSLLPGFAFGLVLSITGSDLTAQSLTAQSLTAQSLTAQSLTAQSLTAQSLTAQSLTAQSLTAQSLTAQSLTAQSLTAQSLSAQSLSAQSLSAQSLPATDALQVFSPNGGEIWKEGEMREISWVSQQDAGAVRIMLETTDDRGNVELTELTSINSSSNSISWAIPAPGDEALQARILIESGGVQDASNAPFTIVPRSTMSFGKGTSSKDRFELRGLYPNPAHHEVTFSWSPAGKNAVVATLYNTSGAVVRTTSVGGHSSMLTIEVKDLPQGAYFYELLTDGHISRGVLAIQR